MMRGPTYDDGYITRKMSSMHGPTFAPPGGAASYGRPPMGGYMQDPYGYDYGPRREGGDEQKQMKVEQKETEEKRMQRDVSPSIPYFWPEKESSNMNRKKGWYRVDFGPQRTTQMWYLPTVKDRLNFLNRHKDSNPDEPFQTPSPFPGEDEKERSSPYWKLQRQNFPTTTRAQRKSKPLICLGNIPLNTRSSSTAPNFNKQIPRPGFRPSVGYEPMRSLSQPPTGAANAPGRVTSYYSGYPPMGPPPRMAPRMGPPPPSYYDYDYGYGGGYGGGYPGGYGYGYAPPPPRMSRYETYMDEEVPEPTYTPRYRSRVPETLNEMDVRDRGAPAHHPHHQAMVPHQPPSVAALRDLPPMSVNDVDDEYCMQPRRLRKAHLQSSPGIAPPSHLHVPGETEGDRHLAKMQARYPSLSEPQMLQDHVDKMRIRLKSIAFSLDPSGPVPDIIVPERPRKGGAEGDKKYTQAIEYGDLPKVASRRQRYYPEDEYLKDNLRIKCLSHYKTTRTAADAQMSIVPSDSSTSRYDKLAGAKWEEPDTVFGTPSDKKPYSKPLTDGTSEESDERKERRKKKKSKERDLPETPAIEASTTPAPPSDFSTTSEVESAAKEASIGDDEAIDEKELKRLEKKKRKAEREAAAKAAMEAELAALAAAEAELARLEAESSTLKTDSPAPPPEKVSSPVEVASTKAGEPSSAPASAEPATEVKSESAADKCESSTEVVYEGVSVTPESLGELPPSESPLQVPQQEEQQSPQVEQMPIEVEEPPKVMEEPHVESQIEEPQVESHIEEPPTKPVAEDVPVETVIEVVQEEQPQTEPQMEQPQPELQGESHVEEIQGEPHFVTTCVETEVEPQLDEPIVEPQVEKVVDAEAVVEKSVKEPVCEVPAGGDFWSDMTPADGGAENLAEEPSKAAKKFKSATTKIMAVGAFLRTHVTQKKSSGTEATAVDLATSTNAAAAPNTDDALGETQDIIPGESDDALIIDATAAATAAANRSEDLLE